MASSWVRAVTRHIENVYPRQLAAGAWDNTGLLLEAPFERAGARDIMLAIDLTTSVAQEALKNSKTGMIIAYHPIIFSGLKSLTLSNPQQASLLKLASAGISVYSPHTAVDAVVGGVNDWLLDGLISGFGGRNRAPIEPSQNAAEQLSRSGMGRSCEMEKAVVIQDLVQNVQRQLKLEHVQVALADGHSPQTLVSRLAVCAGSGRSILQPGASDLCVTGELAHHDLLAMNASGTSVIVCGHSNTERGYLREIMRSKLHAELRGSQDEYNHGEIYTSMADHDPLQFF